MHDPKSFVWKKYLTPDTDVTLADRHGDTLLHMVGSSTKYGFLFNNDVRLSRSKAGQRFMMIRRNGRN